MISFMFEHTLLLTVAIGNRALQTQQLVVTMEMGTIVDDFRHHDVTMTCVHEQILDVTIQILCNHGNCVVSCVTGCVPDFNLIKTEICLDLLEILSTG